MHNHSVSAKDSSLQESLLVTFSDTRGWLRCAKDFTVATLKEVRSRWQRLSNPLRVNAKDLFPSLNTDSKTYNLDEQAWRKNPSTQLIVMIHGLNSSPLAWSNYIDILSKSDSTISCFAPYVYKKGYCRAKEAALPILEICQSYTKQYPNNPIILIGHSNGARIAAYIEQKLDAKNIRLVSIAGPHGGSKLINWIHKLGLTRCFGFSAKMVEELTYQGTFATKKLNKWVKHSEHSYKQVERIFFASADDWRVFPYETCFPKLPNSHYYLVTGESHVTMIDAVRHQVLPSRLNV